MPKRTVCIQNPARVSIRHRLLQVRNDAGESLDIMLPEAFAVVREASVRTIAPRRSIRARR